MKKVLFFVICAILSVSCSKLVLPENWKEINSKSLENTSFVEEIGDVDSEQTWNVAQDFGFVDTLILTPVTSKSTYTYNAQNGGTKAGIYPVTGSPADSYVATSAFTVDLLGVDGNATYTIGVYYTNLIGVQKELNLWSNFTKDSFKHGYTPILPINISFYKKGTVFGFYLEATQNGVTKKYYSERSKNGEDDSPHNLFQPNILNMPPYLIHIEDGFGTHDYSDITIQITDAVLTSTQIKPLDYDKGPWMVICEDYGSECDNDFNDVVFIVRRPNATKIVFELVAAGATRKDKVYLTVNGETKLLGEVHNLFGVEDSIMVNTVKKDSIATKTIDIDVPKEFTMSSENMGGFMVTSMDINGEIFANKKGIAPYMIVLPANEFNWPLEQVPIFEAYPKFANWAKDKKVDSDWYFYPDSTKICF